MSDVELSNLPDRLSYPPLSKWSTKTLRYSLDKLAAAGQAEYSNKVIGNRPITRAAIEAELARRSRPKGA